MRERDIFLAATEIGDQVERLAFVKQACGEDTVLRKRIEELIAIDQNDHEILSRPAFEVPAQCRIETSEESEGTIIGRYKLLEKIGEGGFALVFMAEQLEPVRRRVALKIIKAGMDTRQVIARFEAERQALAMMDHPNIAKVFDGGVTPSGRPYFVMELVRGTPITEFCDSHRLTTNERLRVLVDVCHAVQHAHQKGVIHRDLKPSNILVAVHDDAHVPKVIDFGIAKATQQPLTDRTFFTRFHQFIGTPSYMSPEQATLGGEDIDTRTDVYSLGAVLYELATGVTPFDVRQLEKVAFDEMSRIIREQEPTVPSTRISTLGENLQSVSQNRRVDPQELQRCIRGDLDWIIMKALEKDRSRRYDTVSALAADLQHFLAREPVSAGPPSTLYRLRKFVSRNRGPVAAAIGLSAALVAGTIGSTAGLVSAMRAKSDAVQALKTADRARNDEAVARQAAQREVERKRQLLYVADTSNAKQAWDAGNVDYAVALLDRHVPKAGEVDLRTFAWFHIQDQCHQYDASLEHAAPLHALAYSPDGQVLATAGEGGLVTLWNPATRERVVSLPVGIESAMSLRFSPDGDSLAIGGGTGHSPWQSPGGVEIWDWRRRKRLRTLEAESSQVACVAFTADGQKLACSNYAGVIHLWDLTSDGRQPAFVIQQPGKFAMSIQFSPDGLTLATGSGDVGARKVRFWDPQTGEESQTVEVNGDVRSLRYSPDGRLLAVGTMTASASLNLIDVASRDVRTLPAEDCIVEALAFSSDSKKLFAGNWKGSIHVVDLTSGELTATLKGHSSVVTGLSLSPDGKTLASCSHDRTLKLWDLAASGPPQTFTIGHEWDAPWMQFSHDSKLLATSSVPGGPSNAAGSVRIWDVASDRLVRVVRDGAGVARSMAFSPNDQWLAWVETAGQGVSTVVIRELATEQQKSLDGFVGRPLQLQFSRDGSLLTAIGERQSPVNASMQNLSSTTWRVATGERIETTELASVELKSGDETAPPGFPRFRHAHWGPDFYTRLSRDGELFARGHGSTVRLHDLLSGSVRVLDGHSEFVFYVAFSSTGGLLASCSQDRSICLWNTSTGELLKTLVGRTWPITLAFSPDDATLASGDLDGRVTLWDLRTFTEIVTLNAGIDIVNGLAFAPNGQALASGTLGGKISIWRAPRP